MAEAKILALRQEMTITRSEFLRCLPAAVAHVAFTADGGDIRSLDPAHAWRIALTPLPDLRIALVRLGRFRVEIFLTGYDDARTRRFLERFELYFRRGGG